jgi:large subunit ribosomal protein L29|tara:strand:- start:1229 stop:1432 length:204 start_codon:yes stop_codon:yes gene_type:complete
MDLDLLRTKSKKELEEELLALRREQFNLRIQQVTGQLNQNHEHSRVRKDIARIKTIMNKISYQAEKK